MFSQDSSRRGAWLLCALLALLGCAGSSPSTATDAGGQQTDAGGQQTSDAGSACTSDSQCPGGMVCTGQAGAKVCAPKCHSNADCAPDLVCETVFGHCQQCAAAHAGCGSSGECCSGLTCQRGTCELPPPTCGQTSAACNSDGDCCSGLTCQSDSCQPPPTCQAEGDGCDFSSDCCSGLTCSGGICSAGPSCAPNGASCDLNETILCCSGEGGCNPYTRTCCVMVGSGSCSSNDDCCSGNCVAGACQPANPGGACATSLDCSSGAECPNGSCCVSTGNTCSSGGDCCSGSCVGHTCQCLQHGGFCNSGADCCSGACINDACVGDGSSGGTPDAGTPDAGSMDAGSPDAGTPLPTYPGAQAAQLATETPTGLRISPDEKHVVYTTSQPSGGFSSACGGDFGAGQLAVATVGGSVQQLSSNGSIWEEGFTSDGLHFVWADYQGPDGSDCTPVVMSAAPDGTGATEIGRAWGATSTAAWFDDFSVIGNSVFWLANWYPHTSGDPGEFDGTVVSGGYQHTFSSKATSMGQPDPTGTSLYYVDSGSGHIATVKTGSSVTAPIGLATWSPDGSHLALCASSMLSVMTAAGTNSTSLGPCGGYGLAFSPDGSSVASDDGHGNLVVYPVAGGSSVTLLGLPSGSFELTWLTSRWLRISPYGATSETLLIGDAQHSGAIVTVSSSISLTEYWDATFAHAAFVDSSSIPYHVRVATLPGGSSIDLGAFGTPSAAYEHSGAGLLAVGHDANFNTGLGTLELYSNDGATHLRTVSSTALLDTPYDLNNDSFFPPQPFWAGKVLVYAVNARLDSYGHVEFDLAGASEDGQTTGILATGVAGPVTARPGSSRVFFVHGSGAGGGLWMVDVP